MEQKQENQFFAYSGAALLALFILTLFSSYVEVGSNCPFLNTVGIFKP
ncbi:hypothetical protein [Clostridium minihomine]|nr:hypothetical protein [Clostridium minihomine]